MNKAEIIRVVQLSRVAQGKPTKRSPGEVLNAEKAVAARSIGRSPYTGSAGQMTAPEA
jgi:hypothetical protein